MPRQKPGLTTPMTQPKAGVTNAHDPENPGGHHEKGEWRVKSSDPLTHAPAKTRGHHEKGEWFVSKSVL